MFNSQEFKFNQSHAGHPRRAGRSLTRSSPCLVLVDALLAARRRPLSLSSSTAAPPQLIRASRCGRNGVSVSRVSVALEQQEEHIAQVLLKKKKLLKLSLQVGLTVDGLTMKNYNWAQLVGPTTTENKHLNFLAISSSPILSHDHVNREDRGMSSAHPHARCPHDQTGTTDSAPHDQLHVALHSRARASLFFSVLLIQFPFYFLRSFAWHCFSLK